MEHEIQVDAVSAELIVVKQLPVIEERLRSLKEKWERSALDAEAMVCIEETIQAVKASRAKLNQEFDILEEQRKEVKRSILDPYNRFEAIYKECVTEARNRAVSAYSAKISEVEQEQKRRCEEGLRDYFAELCAVHHLDWLTYERANIKVDMASAKAKTPKRLRDQLLAFVVSVAESVDRINTLEDAGEIMVEYQETLDAAEAICKVKKRHQRIKEQEQFQEVRRAIRAQEEEMVRRVEALAPPEVVEAPKTAKIRYMDFRAHGTLEQLSALKKFAQENKIKLEAIENE